MFGRRANLYVLSWLGDFCSSLFIFTCTRYLAERDGDLMHLGVLGACGSLSYALSAALVGHLCDRCGRRRLIALGAVLLAASYAAALRSMAVPWIYLEYALAGVAFALIFPPLIALLSTRDDGRESRGDRGRSSTRPLILFCLSWNLGIVCGNVSGGLVFAVDPRLSLKIGIGLCLAHLALTLLNAHAAHRHRPEPVAPVPTLDGIAELTPEGQPAGRWQPIPVLRLFAFTGWVANLSSAFSISLVLYIFPQLATSLGISAPMHGAMVMTARISVVSMYILLHFTSFWRYRIEPGLLAMLCAMGGLGLLSSTASVPWLTTGILLTGVFMGYNYFSGIFYSTTGFAGRRGLAVGVHEATLAIGFTAGSLGGGYAGATLGVRAPFQVCVGVVACVGVLQVVSYLVLRRRSASGTQ